MCIRDRFSTKWAKTIKGMTQVANIGIPRDSKCMDLANALARCYQRQKDLENAEKYYDLSLLLLEQVEGADPALAAATQEIGRSFEDEEWKDLKKALKYHQKALEVKLKVKDEDDGDDLYEFYEGVGITQCDLDMLDEALKSHLASNKLREELFGKKSLEWAEGQGNIGTVYLKLKDYKNAVEALEAAYKGHSKSDEEGIAGYMKDTLQELLEAYKGIADSSNSGRVATLEKELIQWTKQAEEEEENEEWEEEEDDCCVKKTSASSGGKCSDASCSNKKNHHHHNHHHHH
eukprot:TRINITY_DN1581_c0_g1_i2.p2 TRINITY_DN1581_c0_g1~~TRINITY_DN1581_c0_g1_i2.p2  ORF type:complete len:306 (-),score=76.81 TRINITY_DN1581_c0_g1_i2:136-1005(-)